MKKSFVFLLVLYVLVGAARFAGAESFEKVRQNMATEDDRLCYWEVKVLEVYLGPGAAPEGSHSLQGLNQWLQGNPAWEPFSASQRLTDPTAQGASPGPILDILLRRRNCR